MSTTGRDIIVMETWAKPGQPFDGRCGHHAHIPAFDPDKARYLSPAQIKEQWPLFDSTCQSCGQRCRIWANINHMKAGGWV